MSQILKQRGVHSWHGSKWECSSCGQECFTDIVSKGIKKTKCDYCIKEHKRLVTMVRNWEKRILKK